jgi:hypothetical protein
VAYGQEITETPFLAGRGMRFCYEVKKIVSNKGGREMRKIFRMLIILFCLVMLNGVSSAQSTTDEKPLIIKGISLGMDINEARMKMESLLVKDWRVSLVGKTEDVLADYRNGDNNVFKMQVNWHRSSSYKYDIPDSKLIGEMGFAIQDKNNYYSGYISADKTNKVTRISFSGKLTNYIFSASSIEVHDFVEQFRESYNLPEFNWIVGGWVYTSPKGYTLTIRTDKFLEILAIKTEIGEDVPKKTKLKFD